MACVQHVGIECPSQCIWGAQQKDALALAAAGEAEEGGTQYWALIQLPSGEIVQRKDRRASVAADWRNHARNHLIDSGEGVAPWEKPHEHDRPPQDEGVVVEPGPAPAAPPTSPVAELGPGAVPLATSLDTPSGGTGPAIIEPPAPMLAPAAPAPAEHDDAEDGAAPRVAEPEHQHRGATPPAGGVALITDELVALCLDRLEAIKDTRIRTQVERIRRVLAELKANGGQAIHPKYRVSTDPAMPF